MNTITMAQWLHDKGYAASPEAEGIWLGQALTKQTAVQIRRIVNRAYLDSQNMSVLADWVEVKYPSSIPFLTLMIQLIDAGTDCDSNWQEELYSTMDSEDLKTIRKMQNMTYQKSSVAKVMQPEEHTKNTIWLI